MWLIWLIFAAICALIEIFNTGFLVIWFAVGALIAMASSFVITSFFIQAIIFAVSSVLLIIIMLPFIKKFQNKPATYKNVSSIENKEGVVTLEINPSKNEGQVRIAGEIWTAKSADNTIIPEGTKVQVEKLDGVKAIVKKI